MLAMSSNIFEREWLQQGMLGKKVKKKKNNGNLSLLSFIISISQTNFGLVGNLDRTFYYHYTSHSL